MTLKEIVEQLRMCGYVCEAGPLENNVAFIELVRMAELSVLPPVSVSSVWDPNPPNVASTMTTTGGDKPLTVYDLWAALDG